MTQPRLDNYLIFKIYNFEGVTVVRITRGALKKAIAIKIVYVASQFYN